MFKQPFTLKTKGIALALSALLVVTMGTPANAQRVGKTAPDFHAVDMDSREVWLSKLKGCGAVVYFFASWCGPCRNMTPQLIEAHRALRDKGVIFIGINLDHDEGAARSYIAQSGIPFSVIREHKDAIADAYQVRGIPQTFIISPKGEVRQHLFGWSASYDLTSAARAVAGGKNCKVSTAVLP
ncbi:MAG: TlpA disulfide reductase family protein [Anaerolineae bacterium]|nr:TlpA disulfide reductase family protein [Anaerolineae bacterium]